MMISSSYRECAEFSLETMEPPKVCFSTRNVTVQVAELMSISGLKICTFTFYLHLVRNYAIADP